MTGNRQKFRQPKNDCAAFETVKELDFESRGFGRSDNYFAV